MKVPFLFSSLSCDCDYLIPNARHFKCCKVEKCKCRKVSKGRRHTGPLCMLAGVGGGGVMLWGPRFCNTCATHISVPLPQLRRIRQRMRIIRPRSPPVGEPSLDLQHMQYPQYLQYLPLRPSTRQVACLFTMCVHVCVCVCVCVYVRLCVPGLLATVDLD